MSMIITLIILVAIATVVHKFVMSAVNNYSYDNIIERYEDRSNHMYWDVIRQQSKIN
jgi:hypothetical protein